MEEVALRSTGLTVLLNERGSIQNINTFFLHQQNINSSSAKYQQFINLETKNINHQPFVNENIKQSSTQHHHINLLSTPPGNKMSIICQLQMTVDEIYM